MQHRKQALTLVELLVVIAIIGLLVGLLLPAVRSSPEAARRNSCLNNLKQISLALLNYEKEHGTLPPAYTVDAEGNRLHSWRTLILPYMEHSALYESIDLTKPWDHPANLSARESAVSSYLCPSFPGEEVNLTTYLAVVGPDCVFTGEEFRELDEITDGMSNTIMVVDANYNQVVHWMSPEDIGVHELLEGLAKNYPELTWQHGEVFLAICLDGRSTSLSRDIDPEVLRGMLTNSVGEEK